MGEHILVVDDESWVVGLVQGYLEQAGFRVSTASDGPSALERFEADDPDLVILDWMLPRLDGLEVTRRIRAQSKVPIILLTARADEGDRVTASRPGRTTTWSSRSARGSSRRGCVRSCAVRTEGSDLDGEDCWHEHQQPEQRGVADVTQERLHGASSARPAFAWTAY